MGEATKFSAANFKNETAAGVALVDFWAEWCGPCRVIAPAIDDLAKAYAGRAKVGKINVDDDPELAEEFGVSSIPTIVVLKDGAEVKRWIGVTKKEDLAAQIDAALA